MPSKYVFRAIGLPPDTTPEDFQRELAKCVQGSENLELCDIDFVPSCSEDEDILTCLFGVKPPLPRFLEDLRTDDSPSYSLEIQGVDVAIDQNFHGLTQLYPTAPGKTVVAE